jgi:hypothetical protein
VTATLFVPVVSIARTKRGRYFWAAWWTGTPVPSPIEPAVSRDATASKFAGGRERTGPSGSPGSTEDAGEPPLPNEKTFKKPDASGGGLRSHEEAFTAAARAAAGALPGNPAAHRGGAPEASLVEIDARWANAWLRMLSDLPPFPKPRPEKPPAPAAAPAGTPANNPSLWEILGISAKAPLEEIKAAYRKRALETHPDHGGDPSAFRALVRAYQMALLRRR